MIRNAAAVEAVADGRDILRAGGLRGPPPPLAWPAEI